MYKAKWIEPVRGLAPVSSGAFEQIASHAEYAMDEIGLSFSQLWLGNNQQQKNRDCPSLRPSMSSKLSLCGGVNLRVGTAQVA